MALLPGHAKGPEVTRSLKLADWYFAADQSQGGSFSRNPEGYFRERSGCFREIVVTCKCNIVVVAFCLLPFCLCEKSAQRATLGFDEGKYKSHLTFWKIWLRSVAKLMLNTKLYTKEASKFDPCLVFERKILHVLDKRGHCVFNAMET